MITSSQASRRLAMMLAGVVLTVLLGLEVYTRTADDFAIRPVGLPADTQVAVLIFHGSQDGDDPLLESIRNRFVELLGAGNGVAVVNYNWSPVSDHRLRATANGARLGESLGRELAGLSDLRELRLVAHSAGAAIPDALCAAYRQAGTGRARVEMTFLDPFGISGFVDWNYGARNHGRCADYAVVYINTDDPAPATNTWLQQAYNIDVTAAEGRDRFTRNGHYWPLQYFLNVMDRDVRRTSDASHTENPRGSGRSAQGAQPRS